MCFHTNATRPLSRCYIYVEVRHDWWLTRDILVLSYSCARNNSWEIVAGCRWGKILAVILWHRVLHVLLLAFFSVLFVVCSWHVCEDPVQYLWPDFSTIESRSVYDWHEHNMYAFSLGRTECVLQRVWYNDDSGTRTINIYIDNYVHITIYKKAAVLVWIKSEK